MTYLIFNNLTELGQWNTMALAVTPSTPEPLKSWITEMFKGGYPNKAGTTKLAEPIAHPLKIKYALLLPDTLWAQFTPTIVDQLVAQGMPRPTTAQTLSIDWGL